MNLTPPYQHPFLDANGQISQPWRTFIDDLVSAVKKLNASP
ncbi:TetR family transcriptional regulator [Acinetobacter seifertii]